MLLEFWLIVNQVHINSALAKSLTNGSDDKAGEL
jgi:hypothetical protein